MMAVYEPGSGASLETESAGILTLGFNLQRNKYLLFISHPVCGTLL
jgi:hypothetical protein